MTYYKVLKNSQSILSDLPISIRVEYKLNEWVKPKLENSPLFVFNSLDKAKSHYTQMSADSIYECEVKNPRRIKVIAAIIDYYALNTVIRFWKNRKRKKGCKVSSWPAPKGTIICDEVKLTKKVVW